LKITNREQRAESKAKAEIASRILNHVFSPGEAVSENQLAESLDMSRTPIRTAMRELIAEGLLERVEPKGYIVPKLTGEDMLQVFLTRQKLEGLAAELAASGATPSDRKTLSGLQEEIGEIYRNWDRDRFTDYNERFHNAVARASGNAYLERFLKQCFWRTQLYIYAYDTYFLTPGESRNRFSKGLYGPTYYEHGAITEAILSGDAAAAREAMERHIRSSCDSLVRRG
jgi:DNA-binding GntR family transcriptional regulator